MADIKEMERVGSRPGQADRGASDDRMNGDWHTARRYYITRGSSRRRITATLLADLGDVNTGDPRVLEDFLAFGVRAYPAERYEPKAPHRFFGRGTTSCSFLDCSAFP